MSIHIYLFDESEVFDLCTLKNGFKGKFEEIVFYLTKLTQEYQKRVLKARNAVFQIFRNSVSLKFEK